MKQINKVQVSQKNINHYQIPHWVWAIVLTIHAGWFGYIYGVLGHVCPAAFLGMWHTSVIAAFVWKEKICSVRGMMLSFLATFVCLGIAFFVLHPVDTSEPHITPGPFVMLFVAFVVSTLINGTLLKKELKEKEESKKNTSEQEEEQEKEELTALELERLQKLRARKNFIPERPGRLGKIDGCITGLTISLVFIVSLWYMVDSTIKDMVWNEDSVAWFDTRFYAGDVWRLWLVIAIIGLISSVSMFSAMLLVKKSPHAAINLRIIGYTVLGMLAIGTIGVRIFLHTYNDNPTQSEDEKQLKEEANEEKGE